MTVVVRRSAVKMWLMALGAIPFLVIAIDVLTNRRISDQLRELLFRPDETQLYEPRDVIWAWAMLLFASVLVLWGLKELFWPTKVVECRDDGLALKLRGPFRRPDLIPWQNIDDVTAGSIDDEGDRLPLLLVKLFSRGDLPQYPWGARWVEQRVLGLLTQDWSGDSEQVARDVVQFGVEAMRRQARAHTARLWGER